MSYVEVMYRHRLAVTFGIIVGIKHRIRLNSPQILGSHWKIISQELGFLLGVYLELFKGLLVVGSCFVTLRPFRFS